MEKKTVQKIEETVVKLLDRIQEQISDDAVCMEEPHPLPGIVEAVAKLIEALKDIGGKYGQIDLNVDEFARTVEEALNKSKGQPPIGGFVKPESLVSEAGNAQSPEVILPIESLQKLTRGAVLQENDIDEQRIREIVKEELAAHEERLNQTWKPLIRSSYERPYYGCEHHRND
ncbi:hypothetical protein WJ0W_004078 [Paenibacillus melissococcoides]|uniref:Uncharacterized protein n=1 Tax=Paenibacillus melissococcoides TaxID=2912268 RepID=A0ABN8U6T6_9BACL|nr:MULTISPECIES: hypothetical protein [Paenibacillus]GIO81932.1 hypothetical protein J6TS7_55420 [Paenibacillus dendritiformis]CAH8246846.1 hypothetical protein WJ0W_004078 [Paenibacillus melissococcoides]CAH8715933.1 hypothetical protein HTL2_004448 [Paenibacillus melissococcoides]CAH8716887.1 hypothetical protein WDD9_004715 [Paenibacillus melissococcoides]